MLKELILAIPCLAFAVAHSAYQCVVVLPLEMYDAWQEDRAWQREQKIEQKKWRAKMIQELIKNAPDGDTVIPEEWN